MQGTAPTLVANHLFLVNDIDPTKLDDEQQETFHQLVAKLLFLCK